MVQFTSPVFGIEAVDEVKHKNHGEEDFLSISSHTFHNLFCRKNSKLIQFLFLKIACIEIRTFEVFYLMFYPLLDFFMNWNFSNDLPAIAGAPKLIAKNQSEK